MIRKLHMRHRLHRLFTLPAAFVLSGRPMGLFPVVSSGDFAILFGSVLL
jgi:hypothetical protein